MTEVDIVVPVLYVNVVLVAMRSGRKSDIALAGWGTTALTIVSFALTVRPGVPFETALFNSALSVLAILCVTMLSLKNIKSQEEVLRARDRIALVSRGSFLKTLSASVVEAVTEPMAAIGANAETACRLLSQASPDFDETKIATRRIIEHVEGVSAVVARVRGSMSPSRVTYVVCDVRTMIESAIDHLRFEIDSARIDVTLSCQFDLRAVIDKVLIEQVIANAILNSIDALQPVDINQRRIWVEVEALPENVQISIKDNGIGVADETLERIFDPFFTAKTGFGMGIGLAVAKSIIDAHNGSIRALPHTPRGLVIEFQLPSRPYPR